MAKESKAKKDESTFKVSMIGGSPVYSLASLA